LPGIRLPRHGRVARLRHLPAPDAGDRQVHDRFFELLAARPDEVKLAVFFMGTVPMIDMAGVGFPIELHANLEKRGILLRLAETHNVVREALRRGGFEQHDGPVVADQTIPAILRQTGMANIPVAT
jgi:MFS superfamily sulfate permease-like transporter